MKSAMKGGGRGRRRVSFELPDERAGGGGGKGSDRRSGFTRAPTPPPGSRRASTLSPSPSPSPPDFTTTRSNTAANARTGIRPINTNINPAIGGNPVFIHTTHPNHPTVFSAPPVAPNTATNPVVPGAFRMADYQNAAPRNTGINFQPQVPDTSNGPILQTYMPRNDVPAPGYIMAHPGFTPANGPIHYHGVPGMNVMNVAPVTAPMHPMAMQQPAPVAQPAMMGGPAYPIPMVGGAPIQAPVPQGLLMGGGAPPGGPFMNPAVHPEPALGVGRTPNELLLAQIQFAYANRMYEPQDFKPGDDDPSRHYFVRELDGNWTQRSRISIDTMGDCRWYITDDGVFYAVRLPN